MPDITSDLEGWWKFDETSGTTAADSTGGGSAGTTSGSPAWVTGQIDNGLEFDGADECRISNRTPFAFEFTDPFTLAAWIKIPSGGGGAIISKRGVITGYELNIDPSFDAAVFLVANYDGSDVHQAALFSGFSSIADDTWHHICGTNSGSGTLAGMKLYVDGVEASTTLADTFESQSILVSEDVLIGATAWGYAFAGIIDDARIYSRALTADDVAALYAYDGVTAIDGVANFTEPNEALASAAVVAVVGVGTFTEPNETLTGIGSVAVVATSAFTEPNETLSSAGEVRWYATAAFTEPNEALTSAAAVAVRADLNSPTEAAEALTSAVTVAVVGVAAFTEPNESLSSEGTVTGGITADAAFTEPNEALTSAGVVVVDGDLANAEPNEALTGVGTVAVVAAAEFTEAGEALSSAVVGTLLVNAAFTEPNEALTSAAAVAVDAQLAGIEATDALTSAVAVAVAGTGLGNAEANESLTSAGLVVILGTGLNNAEPNEQLSSLVDTGVGFVYGSNHRISIGIGIGL